MAQGGIASAIGAGTTRPSSTAPTPSSAGRGLCDQEAVRVLVTDGIRRIADLERYGVQFDRDADGAYQLGREGGHGRHRILHAGGSATGAAIAERLIACVRAEPLIHGARARRGHRADLRRASAAPAHGCCTTTSCSTCARR